MRAKQVTWVSGEFAAEVGGADKAVPLPPVDWFVRGPRGGIYIATGERTRYVAPIDNLEGFYTDVRNRMMVIDESDGVRYVRPRTRLHHRAIEALAWL